MKPSTSKDNDRVVRALHVRPTLSRKAALFVDALGRAPRMLPPLNPMRVGF
jgi:hypothetical protein